MIRTLWIGLLFCLTLSGCFVADDIFLEPAPEPEPPLQERSEKVVTNHIKGQLSDEVYQPYGFSKLKIIKPVELVELENLETKMKRYPKDSTLVKKYQQKKAEISEKNIASTVKIDHFFTLKSDSSEFVIFETSFILNDTLAIKERYSKILLRVPNWYRGALDDYFNEFTIIRGETYAEGRKFSRNFYHYYKTKLETIEDVSDRSDFLRHTLDLCRLIRSNNNSFDQDQIKKSLFERYIKNERSDITNYNGINYSPMYETIDTLNNSILGYYFFHTFRGTFMESTDTNTVMVKMNPYYQINAVFQVDTPIESTTN